MVKVAVVVTARPSWTKLQTICEALRARPDVDLKIVACASALLERYGRVVNVIRGQGFTVDYECWSVYEGEALITSAKETGALLTDVCGVLFRMRPDCVLLCADRHEVLAVAQASAYLHLRTIHLQGGERTGSIDDKVRDAITALSDVHFPCTEQAAFRVYNLTGKLNSIYNFGCSSIDLAARALDEPEVTAAELGGAGADISGHDEGPFKPCVILQHPVTDEADDAYAQMQETLAAATYCGPVVALWPGQDAGAAGISKALREAQGWVHTVRNLPPTRFLRLLSQASVLVGNSSAGIRESSFLGTPVVDIGTRQHGRERSLNVRWVPHEHERIREAIIHQQQRRYARSTLYGAGNAGEKIAEAIVHECTRDRPSTLRIEGLPR